MSFLAEGSFPVIRELFAYIISYFGGIDNRFFGSGAKMILSLLIMRGSLYNPARK